MLDMCADFHLYLITEDSKNNNSCGSTVLYMYLSILLDGDPYMPVHTVHLPYTYRTPIAHMYIQRKPHCQLHLCRTSSYVES